MKIDFLEKLIKQTEEVYKIELNKKALTKNEYDEKATKQTANFTQDALQMSMSTLNDLQPRILQTFHQVSQSSAKGRMQANTF